MNKILLTLAAGLAFANAAQAALYTVEYTAKINTISDGGFPEQFFSSGIVQGNVILPGDTVTGWFTFDSAQEAPVADFGDSAYVYYGFNDATTRTVRFNKSGYTETSNSGSSFILVDDSRVAGGLDSINMVSYTYSDEPHYHSGLSLYFGDSSGMAFNGTSIPLHAFTLPGWTFGYRYSSFGPGGMSTVNFDGEITSMSLIAAVPEPSTYAMFAAGLGLLAWRRKRG